MQSNKIIVQGKRGSYSVPVREVLASLTSRVAQEKLYKEYWGLK